MAQSPSFYLQMRNASGIADIPPSLTLNGNGRIKKVAELRTDSEDGFSRSSRTSSLRDGSSRISLTCSGSDHASATGHGSFRSKSHASRSISGGDSDWLIPDDENHSHRHRTQSPTPSIHSNCSMAFR
jgi:hypothetical protein